MNQEICNVFEEIQRKNERKIYGLDLDLRIVMLLAENLL
jgi:hypothetical protein